MEDTNNPAIVDSQGEQLQDGTGKPEDSSSQTDSQPEQPSQEEDILTVLDKADMPATAKEELKRGYLRQQDYTKKTQELSSLRKELDQAKTQTIHQVSDDTTVAEYLNERLNPLEQRLALTEFKATHSDALDIEPKMVEVIKNNPELADYRMLPVVYELAKARMSSSELSKAKQQVAKRTEAIKAIATGESPAQPKQQPQVLTEEQVKALPLKDLEKLLGI